MKTRYDLIELCAGTAAVSWAALGAPPFPVSRIGSKRGYTVPILEALGIEPGGAEKVALIEIDFDLILVYRSLLASGSAKRLAKKILKSSLRSPREEWERAKRAVERDEARPEDVLIWMAGARGGVGGCKGAHIRRPSVDVFIPRLTSLAKRVEAFAGIDLYGVDALQHRVEYTNPRDYAPTKVYFDPPYVERQSYRNRLEIDAPSVAKRWASAGHHVVVSEARPLSGCDRAISLTHKRRGQTRRSLTRDASEWLSIYEARR